LLKTFVIRQTRRYRFPAMKLFDDLQKAVFLDRPNRFLVRRRLGGRIAVAHHRGCRVRACPRRGRCFVMAGDPLKNAAFIDMLLRMRMGSLGPQLPHCGAHGSHA